MTEQMLQSARRGDWDMLTSREENRQRLLEGVSGVEENEPLDGAAAERQADLIRGILALDHQTRELVRKKMGEISRRFDGEKKIAEVYGPH